MARGYNNHLKWNEQAMFKADLMNVRHRWLKVDSAAFRARCIAEGMRSEDVVELVDWLNKAKAGRRLVPQKSYRAFKFPAPSEEAAPLRTSRAW
jgi:erythromycin esterase-like protein